MTAGHIHRHLVQFSFCPVKCSVQSVNTNVQWDGAGWDGLIMEHGMCKVCPGGVRIASEVTLICDTEGVICFQQKHYESWSTDKHITRERRSLSHCLITRQNRSVGIINKSF
jgi:hypothetical protein